MATRLSDKTFSIQAGAIVLDSQTVLRDSTLWVRNEKILKISPGFQAKTSKSVFDFRHATLIPGLINAHIHLELSSTKTARPSKGRIDEWIAEILRERANPKTDSRKAVQKGIRLCLESGTTAVGEIESLGPSAAVLKNSPLRALIYQEVLGLDPALYSARMASAKKSLRRSSSSKLRFGLSPHAPYSLSPRLLSGLAKLLHQRKSRAAIHLAESRGELEFLKSGRGALYEMLKRAGKIPSNWKEPGKTPADYLRSMNLLSSRMTAIHGNYLTAQEMKTLAKFKTPVVFCPGSHQFFRYENYPLIQLLRAGVCVGLGTDSLASNHSLSMFREMSLVRKRFPRVSPQLVFQMATLNSAKALGWEDRVGILKPGKDADFVVVSVNPKLKTKFLFDALTVKQPKVKASFIAGEKVY